MIGAEVALEFHCILAPHLKNEAEAVREEESDQMHLLESCRYLRKFRYLSEKKLVSLFISIYGRVSPVVFAW